jgi:hypothetical protein
MRLPVRKFVERARGVRAGRFVKMALAVGVAWSVVHALRGYRAPLEGRLAHVHVGWLLAAGAIAAGHRVFSACAWVLVVRSLGHRLEMRKGLRLWFGTETLRWLPGGVWGLFARAARATGEGVPALAASLSMPLELLLSVVAWTVTALACLGLSGTTGVWLAKLPTSWLIASVFALLLTVATALVLARWRPSAAIGRKLQGLSKSLGLLREARPRVPALFMALALFVVLCAAHGVAFLAVLKAVDDSPPGALAVVGINAVGWLVGFFAFFAPTGIGVREATLTAMLAPFVPVDAAIVASFLWRLVQLAVELVCLAGFLACGLALAPVRDGETPEESP